MNRFTLMCDNPYTTCIRAERELNKLMGEVDKLRQVKDRLLEENARLQAERDKAEKCICDIETYLELGSGKYIKQVIDGYNKKPCIHFKNLDECTCNNKPDDYGQCIYENGIEPKNPSAKCKYYERFGDVSEYTKKD